MFKKIRIAILIFILLIVVNNEYQSKIHSVSWKYTLWVNIYPISGDNSADTNSYIQSLTLDSYKPVEEFIRRSVDEYKSTQSTQSTQSTKSTTSTTSTTSINNASIEIRLHSPLLQKPPAPPVGRGMLDVMWWSLQFRWWAYRHSDISGPGPQVRLFVQYFDPKNTSVQHSTALQKGLIGQVNAFASQDMSEQNNVVIAHELLHTLGATDKYDLSNSEPIFPDGYAEPALSPVFPQKIAEIMGGRIPLSQHDAIMPRSLHQVIMGKKTAEEIQLLKPEIK